MLSLETQVPPQARSKVLTVVNLAAAASFVWFLLTAFAGGWVRNTTDFPNYYTAARLAASHGELARFYDFPSFQREMNRAGNGLQLGGYVPQTPMTMVPFLPLATLGPMAAKRVWLVLNLGFLGWSLFLLSRLSRFDIAQLWLVAFLGLGALRQNFLLGQYYVFMMAILTSGVYCLLRSRDASAGVAFASAVILKLYAAPFFLLLAISHRYRAMIGGIVVGLLAVAFTVTLFGWDGLAFYCTQVLPRSLAGETLNPFHPSNNTFVTLLRRMLLFEPELNPHPLADAPGVLSFLQCTFTLAILSIPALASLANGSHVTKRELAWWSIALLLVSPNTASYTFVLLILPVVLMLDELPWSKWPLVLLPYALLSLPLNPTLSVLAPRAWLLAFLFVVAGWPQITSINRRTAQWTAAGIVVAGTCAALWTVKLPETPATSARPVATQLNAVYSGFPVVSTRGIWYESIQGERYVIEQWRDGQFQPFIADGHAFHPSLPDSGTKLYFELVAGGRSSIGFFDLAAQLGVVPVGQADPRDPAVSHNGELVAFVSAGQLFLFDGARSRKVETIGMARDPSFEPGDNALVYASDDSGHSRIIRVDVGSGAKTIVVDQGAELARPSISPDSNTLLFASRKTGNWQIWARDLIRNRDVQLTTGRCNSFAPAWMTDSTEIIFASDCRRGLFLPALQRMPLTKASVSGTN